jgi:hypothetical protein
MVDCLRHRHGDGVEGGGQFFLGGLFGKKSDEGKAKYHSRKTKELSATLDITAIGATFGRFAGGDEVMDAQEFERFTKQINLTRQQSSELWQILDRDGSGEVSKDEFSSALTNMQAARAWLRYCPECIYQNLCAYCQECNANCVNCTENAFCASCWADHPARHAEDHDDEGSSVRLAKLGMREVMRTHLLIRPLNWAYSSPYMGWLPVTQKAVLRQMLRAQQQKLTDASEAAATEEAAALANMKR